MFHFICDVFLFFSFLFFSFLFFSFLFFLNLICWFPSCNQLQASQYFLGFRTLQDLWIKITKEQKILSQKLINRAGQDRITISVDYRNIWSGKNFSMKWKTKIFYEFFRRRSIYRVHQNDSSSYLNLQLFRIKTKRQEKQPTTLDPWDV